jgi:C-5 cytosine-specific DNA methylase
MWLLDLFCGAGGCSAGYRRAGWSTVGIDSDKSACRHYPWPVVRMDAMTALTGGIRLDRFAAVYASPPCQPYSITHHAHTKHDYPDLLEPVLEILTAWGDRTGRPWVVENVPLAPMPPDLTVTLCGGHRRAYDPATGQVVRLRRHRLFASNVPLLGMPCQCDATTVGGVYRGGSPDLSYARTVRKGGYTPATAVRRELIGMTWGTVLQLAQAIPPDYTEHIGWQIMAAAA